LRPIPAMLIGLRSVFIWCDALVWEEYRWEIYCNCIWIHGKILWR
jgi:hypothetical protein